MFRPRFSSSTTIALIGVIGVIAFVAGGGIAAAKPSLDIFGIADPTDTSRVARVESSGTLDVIDAAARGAFQHQVEESMVDGDDNHRLVLGTVQANQRLVIEYISFRALVPAGEEMTLLVLTTTGGGEGAVHFLPLVQQPGSSNVWTSNQLTRIYVDPGTTFTARARRSSSAGTVFLDLTVSGHVVEK